MTDPLKYCVDWNNLSFKDKFLMGSPFIATENKAYKDILRQLSLRDENDLDAWDLYPKELSNLAAKISETLKSEKVWPSSIFLPNDPADIPFAIHFDFTDKLDFLHISIDIIEEKYETQMDEDFWEKLKSISYVEALEEILKKQNQSIEAIVTTPFESGNVVCTQPHLKRWLQIEKYESKEFQHSIYSQLLCCWVRHGLFKKMEESTR